FRRDKAVSLYNALIADLRSREKRDLDAQEAIRLANGNITYSEVAAITHEAAHRMKQYFNKFYRTDIAKASSKRVTAFSCWLAMPRLMLCGTYAAQWDLNWMAARQEAPVFINNPVIMKQFMNYLREEVGANAVEAEKILNLIFQGMSVKHISIDEA